MGALRLAAAIVVALCVTPAATAAPARIEHQTQGSVIVRLSAGENHIVWQEVGGDFFKNHLFSMDLESRTKKRIKSKKRPFGPSVDGNVVLFGEGDITKKIEVTLHDLTTGKSVFLDKKIPWIVEPAVQVRDGLIRAIWERSNDIDGTGLAIQMYEGDAKGRGDIRVLAEGPVLLKDHIPAEYHSLVFNEYPELSGDIMVFQNNEYGVPNVYRLDVTSGEVSRISPSGHHQERPSVSGPYTVWEESEKGFMFSTESAIFVHDARTGEVTKLNQERGVHFQARIHGQYVVYGVKREPFQSVPSVRVFDLAKGQEIAAEKCFPGSIFDYVGTDKGLFAAHRLTPDSSRLLFASWDQVKGGCR